MYLGYQMVLFIFIRLVDSVYQLEYIVSGWQVTETRVVEMFLT